MRSILRITALAALLTLVTAQTQDITTDEGKYDLETIKGPEINADIGTNEGAKTAVNDTTSGGDGLEIGGKGNIISGGQTNAEGSYNGYGNLNHDINSSYNGNTINYYGTAPKVVCIGDWCAEDPPCEDEACQHQRVVSQDGIFQTEVSDDMAWNRLVHCEGARCHYNRCNDEECEQKIVCVNGQCSQEKCQDDECLRKLVCEGGQCQHQPCEGNECGNKYDLEEGEYRICPTCKGAKCPRPQLPGSEFLTRVQTDMQRQAIGKHTQQVVINIELCT
jgi:hypothetical protein